MFKLDDDFAFVVTLFVTRSILHYLLPVTHKLQEKDLDVIQSMDLIQSLRLAVENLKILQKIIMKIGTAKQK